MLYPRMGQVRPFCEPDCGLTRKKSTNYKSGEQKSVEKSVNKRKTELENEEFVKIGRSRKRSGLPEKWIEK